MIPRRTFMIGLASILASPAIASSQKFVGEIAVGTLDSALKYRKISGLMFSSMPTGQQLRSGGFIEDPCNFTFLRDNDEVLAVTINPRANMRWVALFGHEIEIRENSVFRMIVEPEHTHTSLTIESDIEKDPTRPPKAFKEVFRWKDGKPVIDKVTAMHYQNALSG